MISDLLTEMSARLARNELSKMKEDDVEKYEETLNFFITAAEVGVHFLKESPEFRKAFANIHSEFLNYPESHSTIIKAIETANQVDIPELSNT